MSLADLASEHAVSAVTVHRDLQLLSEEGLLERVRGGARSLADASARIETGWNARLREAAPEKDAIAAAARELIEDGSTIFIDASSTGLALAHAIELRPPADLTLVTNSPAIALGLTSPAIHVIVAPGELDQHMRVLTGRWSIDFLAGLNFADGVRLGRRHHARPRPHHVALGPGRHAERRRRLRGARGRPDGLDEVRARLAA